MVSVGDVLGEKSRDVLRIVGQPRRDVAVEPGLSASTVHAVTLREVDHHGLVSGPERSAAKTSELGPGLGGPTRSGGVVSARRDPIGPRSVDPLSAWRVWFARHTLATGDGVSVGEGVTAHGDEAKVGRAGVKRELQPAEPGGRLHNGVRRQRAGYVDVLASGADHDLSHAVGVGFAGPGLRGESFVVMIMAAQQELGLGVDECVEEGFEVDVISVPARRKPSLVLNRQGAPVLVRSKICLEPGQLAPRSSNIQFGVERHHVPSADVLGVIALSTGFPRRFQNS